MFIVKFSTMLIFRSKFLIRFLLVATLFSGSVFTSSCIKSNGTEWLFYDETSCADAWPFAAVNEKLKENITEHYKEKGIRIYDLEIFVDRTPEVCAACTCKTGRRVKVKVKSRDVEAMQEEKFYK